MINAISSINKPEASGESPSSSLNAIQNIDAIAQQAIANFADSQSLLTPLQALEASRTRTGFEFTEKLRAQRDNKRANSKRRREDMKEAGKSSQPGSIAYEKVKEERKRRCGYQKTYRAKKSAAILLATMTGSETKIKCEKESRPEQTSFQTPPIQVAQISSAFVPVYVPPVEELNHFSIPYQHSSQNNFQTPFIQAAQIPYDLTGYVPPPPIEEVNPYLNHPPIEIGFRPVIFGQFPQPIHSELAQRDEEIFRENAL